MAEFIKTVGQGYTAPLLYDVPIEADTLVDGEFVRLGVSDGDDLNFAVSAESALGNSGHRILGIISGGKTSTLDIDTSSTFNASGYHPVIINPNAVFKTPVSTSTSDDIAASGGGTASIEWTCTNDEGMPHLGSSWAYFTAGTHIGTLVLIEDSSTTTTTCTAVLVTTLSAAVDNTDAFVVIHNFGQHVVMLGDVDIVQDVDSDYDAAVTTGTSGVGVMVLEAIIEADNIASRKLGIGSRFGQASDDGRSGLNNAGVRFYQNICFGGLSHALNSAITRA